MMGIGAVGSYEYGYGYGYGVDISPFGSAAASGTASADDEKSGGIIVNPGESTKVSPGRRSSPAECETCKNRKYQDGSDEMVSFKSASHISPQASASRVRAHEQEHVSNAYKTGKRQGSLGYCIPPDCHLPRMRQKLHSRRHNLN